MSKDKINYESIISSVRMKLGSWSGRISDAPAGLRWSWWPDNPDIQDELLSDYGIETEFRSLENEFREEVQAIRETLDELGHKPTIENWQKSSIETTNKFWQSQNQVADALSIWDQIGVPIRHRGEVVFRIWSPRDVMGSPVIKALPVDEFIDGVSEQTALDRIEIVRIRKIMDNWRAAAIALAVITAFSVAAWIF